MNQVWNWCNATSLKACTPYAGKPRWLSGFDLCSLSAGASGCFERIGADVIQRVCTEYATKRTSAKRRKLRWRASSGRKRALGWIPFKAATLRRRMGGALRFMGKSIRVFERDTLANAKWRDGCFAQDALGDWWLCLPIQVTVQASAAPNPAVGIDLGLKATATTSDGDTLAAGTAYRDIEAKIASAQRRGHKRQAKRWHRLAVNRRKDALHKFTTRMVEQYQHIVIGDVSAPKLAKTRMAKAVLDCGWGLLKTQLDYKGQQAARSVEVVSERNTSRACSNCGQHSGPRGLSQLVVRTWVCSACGVAHDRDVNAARNILARAKVLASVSGNTQALAERAPSSRASSPAQDTDQRALGKRHEHRKS